MSEEMKLLYALCDALGFEVVKRGIEVPYSFKTAAMIGAINPDTGLHKNIPGFEIETTRTVNDYSVVKKGKL